MADVAKKTEKDLQTAITELILELKGAGTAEALSEKIGVPRNRLTLVFKAYKDRKDGVKTESKPPHWGLDTLDTIAKRLGIKVSDIILAAEDIQAGLPPWFHHRIAKKTFPHSQNRFVNIILEAYGVHYSDFLRVNGQRKSLKHCPENWITEDQVQNYKAITNTALKTDDWKSLLLFYECQGISDENVYNVIKKMMNKDICIKKEKINDKKFVDQYNDQLKKYLLAIEWLGKQVSKERFTGILNESFKEIE